MTEDSLHFIKITMNFTIIVKGPAKNSLIFHKPMVLAPEYRGSNILVGSAPWGKLKSLDYLKN